MRKTIRKWFWAWDFEKEEKWLNELAAKGLCLVSVGYCKYEFEQCLPGEYGIKLEFLEKTVNHPESVQYISFLEDTGAEHVGSYMRWVYLRKKRADGEFELYSDTESKIKHLNRILSFIMILGALNLYLGIYNTFLFISYQSPLNLVGILSYTVAAVAAFGSVKLFNKRKKLKNERSIFEQ